MTTSEKHPRSHAEAVHEETLLPLEHGDLHIRQDGPRDAPVLLLLHGSATTSTSWNALVPLLADAHRVIRVDLPGHGRSAEPVRGYDTAGLGQTLGAALDRLGVRRATVVGHSSGGYAATALAERRPDLVSALVLVNTGPGLHAYIAPETAAFDPARWPPTDEQIRHFASGGFREGFEVPQDLVDELRESRIQAVTAAMRASMAYLGERALPERLTALGKPLLVIFGDRDRRWRPASAADYRAVPGAVVTMLPGAGHTPILEEPSRTAALVLAFARSQARRAADAT
ncbi:alpha/beta fold hydrolase [Streptomyces sp. NPDC048518]|uniref:alpha/beta fold hydrolase n=1 Tax=Streptomyces sp. NPDC048518 TaxID=3155029 RepID=UPI0033D85908